MINKEVIDILIGFFSGILVSGIVFYYFYSKLFSQKEDIKEKALEFYYQNKLLLEKENLKDEFEELANKTLQTTTSSFMKNSYESLNMLLNPFKNDIVRFKDEIENYYLDEAKERFALKQELKTLGELNYKLQEESSRLTNALTSDNKFAGSWGEFVLESLLESSGLRKGYEYDTQVDFKTEEGRYRPDVIVSLPHERKLVIDSKVSLKAYEKYVNDHDREALNLHLSSVKNHIKELSKKEYQKLFDTIDIVLLFIPVEGAFVEAIKNDKELFNYAYEKNIILVSPTTLIAVLKTVEYSWKKEFQNKNAQAITQKASKLYDKFSSFIDDMQTVESSLKKAQNSYESAFKKLSTGNANLLKLSSELKELENVFDKKVID